VNFTFTTDQLNTILRMLDQLPHGQVRQVIDYIMTEANRQMAQAQTANEQKQDEPEAVAE
jgi:hypothetical protein